MPVALRDPRGLVIFDLDGTLIDSAPSILASFSFALAQHGFTPAVPLDRCLIGPPLMATLATISGTDDNAVLARLAESFKEHYDHAGYRQTCVYDGVAMLLQELRRVGWELAIATNKRARPTERILEHLGWTPLFCSVMTLDTATPPYPNKAELLTALLTQTGIRPTEAVMVGDTEGDAHAAMTCNLPYIHVNWGYGDPGPGHPVAARCAAAPEIATCIDALFSRSVPCANA